MKSWGEQMPLPLHQFGLVLIPILGQQHQHGSAGDQRWINSKLGRAAVAPALQFLHPLLLAFTLSVGSAANHSRWFVQNQTRFNGRKNSLASPSGKVPRENLF